MKDMKKFRWFSCVIVVCIVFLAQLNVGHAEAPVPGVCGASNGAPFTIALPPTTGLCAEGSTANVVTGTDPWIWTCTNNISDSVANCWAYVKGTVVLPKTGQTKCYDNIPLYSRIQVGTELDYCYGTGQDGEKLVGAAQTDPLFTDNGNGTITDNAYGMTWQKDAATNGASIKTGIAGLTVTRFTDNLNGTITDNLTGLVWLKNAYCMATLDGVVKDDTDTERPRSLSWAEALVWSNNLADGFCDLADGSVAGDWRMPNINELVSLPTNFLGGDPAVWLNNPAQGIYSSTEESDLKGFRESSYWSSTTVTDFTSYAWVVGMGNTNVYHGSKTSSKWYVLPVKGGQAGTISTLAISKEGSTGAGLVSSQPAGISCGADCSSLFDKEAVVVLSAAASTGSAFTGWTGCDEGGASGNQCTVTVTGAKSVAATFTINSYTVSFNSIGGSTIASQSVDHNSVATAPTSSPSKTGYTFVGWYSNVDVGTNPAFDFATPITSNITLYAKWAINSYDVIFDSKAGSAVPPQRIQHGSTATAPTVPTRSDYAFSGWYDSETDSPFSFTTAITKNKTLYAKWTYNLFSVTPSAGNNSSISPATVQNKLGGSTVNFTISPTAPGYGVHATASSGCSGGTLSGNIYTTGAITGNCTVTVTAVKRNGNGGTSISPTVADALKVLQAYYGGTSLSAADKIRYDVAPVVDGVPAGDGKVDIADVILILRRIVGIGSW